MLTVTYPCQKHILLAALQDRQNDIKFYLVDYPGQASPG